jgi:threonine/homoserine/homoserine lactone efflux protein
VPIVAVVLMLGTQRGKVNGPAFVIGWIVGLVVVGVIVLLVAGGISASSATTKPKTWVSLLKLVLGGLLGLVAVRQWRTRPRRDSEPDMPGWMTKVDSFTPVKTLGLAALLSAVTPRTCC